MPKGTKSAYPLGLLSQSHTEMFYIYIYALSISVLIIVMHTVFFLRGRPMGLPEHHAHNGSGDQNLQPHTKQPQQVNLHPQPAMAHVARQTPTTNLRISNAALDKQSSFQLSLLDPHLAAPRKPRASKHVHV